MTLVLTPENLGPVEVSVTLSKGTVDLTLRGAHEQGRAALLDGAARPAPRPRGRRPAPARASRSTGTPAARGWPGTRAQQGQQQGFGDRGGQHDRGENRSRPWGAPADTAVSGPTPTPNRSTSSGVDVRV